MGSIVVGNVRFIVWIKEIRVGVDQNKKEIALIIILQERVFRYDQWFWQHSNR
jgi:hypothetical protein